MTFGTSIDDLSIEERLIAAKVNMLIKLPFFGNMAPRLELTPVDWCPFGATDGSKLYYNPEGLKDKSISQLIFFYAHELLHVCFEHFFRRDDRNTKLWNIATDYAINAILKRNKIGTEIKGCLYDKKYENMAAEEIYEDLQKNIKSLDIDELTSMMIDTHLDLTKNLDGSPKSQEEIESLKNEIKKSIIDSVNVCQAGNVPMELDRLIQSITKPQLPWEQILQQSIKSKIKNDFTFARPNKRSFNSGIYFPSMTTENEIDICIAIDASGSISDELLQKFMTEINGIITDFKSWKITLWSFDTKVYSPKEYSSEQDSDIFNFKIKGGGGTSFECNWDYMKSVDMNPKIFIMFTDMCPCGSWGDPNYCDTLFVSTSKNINAPFGETIEIN